jgi:hypothetical protein
MWRDTDLDSVDGQCKPDPDKPNKLVCGPPEYESSFAWDAADNTLFRPVTRFLAVETGRPARNVNSWDETPDSSWFTNRIGKDGMTPEAVAQGYCDAHEELDPQLADGAWVIDQGKPNGANPGFRVKMPSGQKYMLKADPEDQPERATGATSIASRIYFAAGWFSPCDSVVYFRPSLLRLSPGLTVTDNSGVTKPFDAAALDNLLRRASHRGGLVRMVASKWLPGRALGPFTYAGVYKEDPSDVIPHEDRRDLRGARLIAAWLNHFDSREQNTMMTWMPDPQDPRRGHVRHWYIDLGDCFGSEWEWEGISKRLGYSYYFDPEDVVSDFATLGLRTRPWDRAQRNPDARIFGFFRGGDFEPEFWKGGYPNPTFARMDEHDGAWAARIIAKFTDAHVLAAVQVGNYTDPEHVRFLTGALIQRRDAILRRYFSRLSPLSAPKLANAQLCLTDLARQSQVWPATSFAYSATLFASGGTHGQTLVPVPGPAGEVCVNLKVDGAATGAGQESERRRFLVLDVFNGVSRGPLRVHLYDEGKDGYRLAGLERPLSAAAPAFSETP